MISEFTKACALKVDCGFLLHSPGDVGNFGRAGIAEGYEISGPFVATWTWIHYSYLGMLSKAQKYEGWFRNCQTWPRKFQIRTSQKLQSDLISHYAGQQREVKRRQLGLEQVWWSQGSVWCLVPAQQFWKLWFQCYTSYIDLVTSIWLALCA